MSSPKFNPYRILGIDREADLEMVRSAYRQAARACHPDVSREPEAGLRFSRIAAAYEILSNSSKRELYDRYGTLAIEKGFDLKKIKLELKRHAPGNTDGLASFLGGVRGEEALPRQADDAAHGAGGVGAERGDDLVLNLTLDAAKAKTGGQVRIAPPSGGAPLEVTLPPGLRTGQHVRLLGKGFAAVGGGRPGDLLLIIQVGGAAPHELPVPTPEGEESP